MRELQRKTIYRLQPNSSGKAPAYDVELQQGYDSLWAGGFWAMHRITVYDFWQVKELAKDWANGAFDWKEVVL